MALFLSLKGKNTDLGSFTSASNKEEKDEEKFLLDEDSVWG
jgi:hypothetical protein